MLKSGGFQFTLREPLPSSADSRVVHSAWVGKRSFGELVRLVTSFLQFSSPAQNYFHDLRAGKITRQI